MGDLKALLKTRVKKTGDMLKKDVDKKTAKGERDLKYRTKPKE